MAPKSLAKRHSRHLIFLIILGGVALAGSLALYALTMPIVPGLGKIANGDNQSSSVIASTTPIVPAVREYLTDIPSATMIAVGDIMLGRNVETLREKKGNTYPFEAVSQFFWNSDFVMGNLEGPISTTETHTKTPNNSFSFSFDPSVPGLLSAFNVWAVTLANNHMFDKGKEGLLNTKEVLADQGIVGFGHPTEVAYKHAFHREVKGERISFIGFNMVGQDFDVIEAAKVIERAKKEKDSHVMVAIHWGEEYATSTSSLQRTIAHALVDAGADVIWGSHPHVVQPMELYRDKPIFYSLGNFIFDQYFSKDVERGLAVKVSFFPTQVRYDLFPIRSYQSQPALMTGEDREVWLKLFSASTLKHISRFSSLFYSDDSVGNEDYRPTEGSEGDFSLKALVGDSLNNEKATEQARAKQLIKDIEKGYFVVER